MKGKSFWLSMKISDWQDDRLSRKLFGKPLSKLTDAEYAKFKNVKYGKRKYSSSASSDYQPIEIETGNSDMLEDKPVNPSLVSFCKAIYRPLSVLSYFYGIAAVIMALFAAYDLWKAVSASGISALLSAPLLRIVILAAAFVILKVILDKIFRVGWRDELAHK